MKTLFFDLDDTILAYHQVSEQSWQEACEAHIEQFPSLSGRELLNAVLEASSRFWSDPERFRLGRLNLKQARRDVLALTFKNLDKAGVKLPSKEVAHAIADHFTRRREELVEPFDGAIHTLKTLRTRKTPLALITNGAAEVQQSKIDRFKLAPYFDIILIEGALGFGKPDPRVFERALFHFEVAPHDATMIGDSLECDIYGAQQLGIGTVWNDWNKRGLPEDAPVTPDRTIHHIRELII